MSPRHRTWFWVLLAVNLLPVRLAGSAPAADPIPVFSRLVLMDTRGSEAEETVLIVDQRGSRVSVYLENYLGRRTGNLPVDDYFSIYNRLQKISVFAIKPEYQGKFLRAHAAHGTLTIAWKAENGDKQIRTIRYYAPEHQRDDFRYVFNQIWALARYAILSPASFESPKFSLREDALFFSAGFGWLTGQEIQDAINFYVLQGQGQRLAAAIWCSLDQSYAADSELANRKHLEYCVRKSLQRIGKPAVTFLSDRLTTLPQDKRELADKILKSGSK